MKISYNWLLQYISTPLSPEALGDILTQTGLEVEGVYNLEKIPGGLKGLIVGEVISAEPHQNADRLKLTRVDIGRGENLQIVCGAPNVAQGQKVVVATVGTVLFPTDGEPFKIKKGKIRGEESYGMICAEDEIGLGLGHDGIMVLDEEAAVGSELRTLLNLENDACIEIGLTPNRTDGMSHMGVARDLRAALRNMEGISTSSPTINWPDVSGFEAPNNMPIEVVVKSPEDCPRYSGVCISGLKIEDSPEWLQERLRSIGLNPINNVVDVTNFVMHEMGQPLHAFDFNEIEGNKIVITHLPEGTKFTTLDEVERTLSSQDLMICNGFAEKEGLKNEAAMCIGGVFGGIRSGVKASTQSIFLESAYFDPISIRKSAKRHALSTDASFRFERGVDPDLTLYALKRAALLIEKITGGKVSSSLYDFYPEPFKKIELSLNLDRMKVLIGQKIDQIRVESILNDLDFQILQSNEEELLLSVPLYRRDVTREADVVEEVLRIYGYNAIALPSKLNISLNKKSDNHKEDIQNSLAELLVSQGFTEIMSNSLSNHLYPSWVEDDGINPSNTVEILNPLSSELQVMRQSLVFQGLEAIDRNIKHKYNDLKLFEFGRTYHKSEVGYDEKTRMAIFCTGKEFSESWNNPSHLVGYPKIRASMEHVFEKLGFLKSLKMKDHQCSWMNQGKEFVLGRDRFGFFGEISTALLVKFDIHQAVYYAEVDWDMVLSRRKMNKVRFKPLAKFPKVRRDLSLLLDDKVEFAAIQSVANKNGKKLLKNIDLFDFYEGENLPKGKKSYAVSFIFQDDTATLKDKQIDAIMNKIISSLQKELSAELR